MKTSHKVFLEPQVMALADAISADHATPERVKAFVAHGGNLNLLGDHGMTLLMWALLNKRLDAMNALLVAGADWTTGDDRGVTVVHVAAGAENPAYLDTLLVHHADPNTCNTVSGGLPLTAAMMSRRQEQFDRLLGAGADVNRPDHTGNTPLHHAAKINDLSRLLQLLHAKANPAAINKRGATFRDYLRVVDSKLLTPQAALDRLAIQQLVG